MNCHPKPEVPCGTTIPETCVTIVDNTIFQNCPAWALEQIDIDPNGCYRQSEFNKGFANAICGAFSLLGQPGTCIADVYTPGSGILGNIYLGCINDCDGLQIPLTVREAIQDLYSKVCNLETNLDLPIGDIDPKCLVNQCEAPITTLGPLLQALVDEVCDSVGTVGIYRAVITSDPAGVVAPTVTVLENSLKFGNLSITPVWARTGAGIFTATVPQPIFVANKTFLLIGAPLSFTVNFARNSTTVLDLTSSGVDNALVETAVEIRIYS